jgi:hypothetical protein
MPSNIQIFLLEQTSIILNCIFNSVLDIYVVIVEATMHLATIVTKWIFSFEEVYVRDPILDIPW